MDEFEIKENTYKLSSSIYFGQDEDNLPGKTLELENNEIGFVIIIIFFYKKKQWLMKNLKLNTMINK